jgi:hypothetical protein
VLENAAVRFPALAGVVGAEEDAGVSSQIERVGLLRPAGLDVPRRFERQRRFLGQAELLRALPGLPAVRRALDGRTVDEVVGRRVNGAVTRVDGRVVDPPAVQQRALRLPLTAIVVSLEQEESLARADQC